MILRSVILEILGDKEYVKKIFLGYQVYSFFINQIKKINKTKANYYHQKNYCKPFTLSRPFLLEERIFIRICFLNDEVFNIFVSSLFDTHLINLGKKRFRLKKIYLAKEKDLPFLVKRMIRIFPDDFQLKNNLIRIKTFSPFLFKSGLKYQSIPNFQLIKNSFEKKQKQIYGKICFQIPEFVIEKLILKSQSIKIEPFSEFIGSHGEIVIKIKEKKLDIFALEFFGFGVKTTMGLGQILVFN